MKAVGYGKFRLWEIAKLPADKIVGLAIAVSDNPSSASGTPNFGHTSGAQFPQVTGGKKFRIDWDRFCLCQC
jgi:hypothetical protein